MEEFHRFELFQAILVILGIGVVAYSPIARAIGRRIMHGKTPLPGAAPQDDARLDDLSGEVTALRQAMYEQQERLDFAERLLAQARERGQLNAPKDS
jgi:hypothetical protein